MAIVIHQRLGSDRRAWLPDDIESAEPLKYEMVDGNLLLLWPIKSL